MSRKGRYEDWEAARERAREQEALEVWRDREIAQAEGITETRIMADRKKWLRIGHEQWVVLGEPDETEVAAPSSSASQGGNSEAPYEWVGSDNDRPYHRLV